MDHIFLCELKATHDNSIAELKEINSNVFSSYALPDSEFDIYIRTILTRRHTREKLGNTDTKKRYRMLYNFCELVTAHAVEKNLTPVRYNRKNLINLRLKRNRDFMYRAA